MWIRSQDKNSLRNYQGISGDSDIVWGDANNSNDLYVLGQYNTKDRVRAVLDDIQWWIAYDEHYSRLGENTSACQNNRYTIYQMPEK